MEQQLSYQARQKLRRLHRVVSPSEAASKYCIHKLIGAGGYSKIYVGSLKADSSKHVALKMQKLDEDILAANPVGEITHLRALRHEHLLEYKDSFISNNKLWIVTEFVHGHDLSELMRLHARRGIPFEIHLLGAIVQRISSGLAYLHASGVVHRDVKPENVLLSRSGQVKLVDLGLAKTEAHCKGVVGTFCYTAPEVFINRHYDRAVDIFSLGMTIQALWNGEQPYNGVPEKKMVERITHGDLQPTHYTDLRPRELISFLFRCLQMDPKMRIKAASIQSHILVKGFRLSQHEMAQAFAALNTAPLESWDPERAFPIP